MARGWRRLLRRAIAAITLQSGIVAAAAPELAIEPARATSAPAPTSPVPAPASSTSALLQGVPSTSIRGLLIPVQGVRPEQLVDTFTQARSEGRVHDAIDILAPRGTPVLAVGEGTVVKLFTSRRGGLTVYQFDPSGMLVYYYAHLDGYAPGLAEGKTLHRGDPIGFVGSTGNASAEAPHLHFEIQRLGPQRQWWRATSINPYPWLKADVPPSAHP